MRSNRWLFISLAVLVSVQMLWWAYLIIYQQSLIAEMIGSPDALQKAHSYRIMIVFEGAFFLFVWAMGIWIAYRSIDRELRLLNERRSFLSAITHELKTPLSTIQLSLETLSRSQVGEEQKQKFLQRALKACRRLFNEIESILTYNESDKARTKQVFVLHEAVQDVVSDFDHEIKVASENSESTQVIASLLETKSILKNVIDNSVKYSSVVETPMVTVNLETKADLVEVAIKDNGIGLSNEALENIFKPFWRSDEAKNLALEGSGLGLTLVNKLAKKNAVKIRVHSNGKGQGTVVYLEWPRYKEGNAES